MRAYESAKVTCGTTSAPYLAKLYLQQLAEYESKDISLAP